MASLIDQILETRKITEYLSGKGHNPLGNAGAGKLKYCCPIHKGDNDPSFFVYTDSKYENFYCYGCKVGGNVINLYANLEGVSVGKAVAQLGDGLEYDETSSNEEVARRLEAGVVVDEPELLASLVMSISTVSRLYLEQVDFDVSEALFLNKVQEVVDRIVYRGDIESLQEVYFRLSDEWFTSRYKVYAKEQEQDKRDNVIWQQMAGKEAI